MRLRWLFVAYLCSGAAGLVYQVAWMRLFTLYLGHTTAAASTVTAAFLGGLGAGAVFAGRAAPRLPPRQALFAYASLETAVAVLAVAMPYFAAAMTPGLRWSYQDAGAPVLFPIARLAGCLLLLLVPAMALGATFPLAIQSLVTVAHGPGAAGRLYAANTIGAAIGSLAAGFFLIPLIGLSLTLFVGAFASGVSVAIALGLARDVAHSAPDHQAAHAPITRRSNQNAAKRGHRAPSTFELRNSSYATAASIIFVTGFVTMVYEIAWTRVFAMTLGPSIYAFASTLTSVIIGLAAGSYIGAAWAERSRRLESVLTWVLGTTALVASVASATAGGPLLHFLLEKFAVPPQTVGELVFRHTSIASALVGPIALGLGIAFPLTLALAGGEGHLAARRLGVMYAINTFGAVLGALATGFAIIALVGLERTLSLASLFLTAGATLLVVRAKSRRVVTLAAIVPASALCISAIVKPSWDRALMGSGAYMYGRVIPKGVDPETALRAGTSLYYREGASSTVSVKRLTGDLSLAIDGKVDASTSGDMLTQKTLAHLPLLLHPQPRDVAIVGLGSGVTLASALVHPIAAADVIEISPEVIEASAFFNSVNRNALNDPRTRLITGDGRSHLSLTSRQYDVIISEPSNPWMAGVAALFTREFFVTVRSRLAPGGIFCQWTHTYAISETDLRSIVATFASVFPNGTMWLIGTGDLLLIGSNAEISLENIATGWRRPGVAPDLGGVAASTPFSLLSLYCGGAEELRRMQDGAPLQTDDRMALEFSGPLALQGVSRTDNAAMLRRLLPPERRPAPVADAFARATAADWRGRAAMLMRADAYSAAYQDYVTSLTLSPTNAQSLGEFVRAAVAAHREVEATEHLKAWLALHPQSVALWTTLSKLYAVQGALADAVNAATVASRIEPSEAEALEQLASVYADAGNPQGLEPVVDALQQLYPERSRTAYFAASLNFLTGRMTEALQLVHKSIDKDPLAAPAYNMLGAIYASMDQRGDARTAFETALGLDPRDPAVYVNLALLELSTGRHDQAANLFAEALSLDPQSTAARQGLAQAKAARIS